MHICPICGSYMYSTMQYDYANGGRLVFACSCGYKPNETNYSYTNNTNEIQKENNLDSKTKKIRY